MSNPKKIVPINWVRVPSLYSRVQQFFKGDGKKILPYLKQNPFYGIGVPHLDQGKDGSCVVFGFYSAIMHNTNLRVKSDEAMQTARDLQATDGYIAWMMAEKMAEAYSLARVTFKSPLDPDALKVLDLGYALACSTNFPVKFFIDWVADGIVDSEYERSDKNTKAENQTMIHFMVLKKNINTGEYFFRNSWGAKISLGLFNEYKIKMDIIKKKNLLYRDCFLLV